MNCHFLTDLCYSDPLLYDAGPLSWCCGRPLEGNGVCWLAEQGHDDLVGNGVKLSNGGTDGWRHVFLLVSLWPHTAQTLVRHHVDKQSLKRHENQSSAFNQQCKTIEMSQCGEKTCFTYRVHSGELFSDGSSREIHDATLIQRVFPSWILITRTLLGLLHICLGRTDICLSSWGNTHSKNQEKVSVAFWGRFHFVDSVVLRLSVMLCGEGSPSFWKLLSSASVCAANEQKLGWLRMLSWTAELILRWSNSSLSAVCRGGSLKSSLYSSNHVWTKANRGLRRQWKNCYTLTI